MIIASLGPPYTWCSIVTCPFPAAAADTRHGSPPSPRGRRCARPSARQANGHIQPLPLPRTRLAPPAPGPPVLDATRGRREGQGRKGQGGLGRAPGGGAPVSRLSPCPLHPDASCIAASCPTRSTQYSSTSRSRRTTATTSVQARSHSHLSSGYGSAACGWSVPDGVTRVSWPSAGW